MFRAGSFKITVRAMNVSPDLRLQIINRPKLPFRTQSIQKTDADDVAVQIPVPIHYVCLDRRFRGFAKRGSQPNIGYATTPMALNQGARYIDTVLWYDAVVRV